MATLFAAPKPRLTALRIIRKLGNSFATISAEPSLELLSTISASIRRPFASRCTSSRHSRNSSLVLNDTTTTEASYDLFSAGSKGGSQFSGKDVQPRACLEFD